MVGLGSLPSHSSVVEEKLHRTYGTWTRPWLVPIPGVRSRRLRIPIPNVALFQSFYFPHLKRKRGPLFILVACVAVFTTFVILVSKTFRSSDWGEQWQGSSSGEAPTLVFRREDLQRIWKWEIESGHYPSQRLIPFQIGLKEEPSNPAIPRQAKTEKPSRYRSPQAEVVYTDTLGVGPKRVYLDIQSTAPNVAYPPRPVPGSVADLDEVMRHCDFSQNKYVRDCLEVLRIGGGLDNGERLRRDNLDHWKYVYVEQADDSTDAEFETTLPEEINGYLRPVLQAAKQPTTDPDAGLYKKWDAEWETQVVLPSPLQYKPASTLPSPCDPENPRIFHMFWTGPFTDKPYLALLSFLFTQNTGIHHQQYPEDSPVCRPQFWLWINPGPAASEANPSAVRDMFDQLKNNPWASPFLHPRFKDVIQFKLWNTTEQLDGIPEIKDEWRNQESLFNSGGHTISIKPKAIQTETTENATSTSKEEGDDLLNRTGSKSSSSYDRMSVILSDMARFVLCHRFGGIYLDADTIFLRDWEELWGWKGAFAYRWSRLPKYNTAVLKMNKGSALGTFLFRTALKNGLDFHPMTVSLYTADAYLEPLLLRLPDAMFDSAWLNTEEFQRDRPPQPYFTEFSNFFETPVRDSAAPQALGFNGFFKGAYSYHFHNFWWKPFDSARNFPDLGPRFKAGEEAARAALKKNGESIPEQDKLDLDWSTVLKRTFESYIRGERPNMYGEWLQWKTDLT